MEYSIGLIKDINEDNFIIRHLCDSAGGSSVSPIINSINFQVIGIHKGTPKGNNNWNLGTLFKEPIEIFNNKNENNKNDENENNKKIFIKENYNTKKEKEKESDKKVQNNNVKMEKENKNNKKECANENYNIKKENEKENVNFKKEKENIKNGQNDNI